MNDKCASGTGATIDKCMIKVGMPPEETLKLHFDDARLHHVAAKCGVFAETDIVNLVKTGIPSDEIMCSLADAIELLLGDEKFRTRAGRKAAEKAQRDFDERELVARIVKIYLQGLESKSY